MDSKTNSQIIIENIKHEIKIQNLKLDFIAKSLGISIGEFSKILSGERKNFYKYLFAISNILNVEFMKLFYNKEHKMAEQFNLQELENLRLELEKKEFLIAQFQQTIKANEIALKALEELLKLERELKEDYRSFGS